MHGEVRAPLLQRMQHVAPRGTWDPTPCRADRHTAALVRQCPGMHACSEGCTHVNTCDGQVAAWLWSLVVGRARLAEHLAALRSYFLLARGDFWQAFLLEARPPAVARSMLSAARVLGTQPVTCM